MRQLLTFVLSLGTLVLPPSLAAQPGAGASADTPSAAEIRAQKGVELAQLEVQRIKNLVDAGALPRIRVEQAEADLADAQDEAILERTLYGPFPAKGTGGETSAEMIAAAQRRVDRQQARLDRAREIVAAGVAAQSYVLPLQEELTLRQTSVDLAHLRARLITEDAALANIPKPADITGSAMEDFDLFAQGMEHYEGTGGFEESRDLAPLELAFASRFARSLPISAEGETEVHRALGFDHRGRVDVAVDPSQPEGVWLRQYLKLHNIPYYAFMHAIPGKATAAHVHIGPGSTRLATPVSRLGTKQAPRSHSAD
jgi:hypothetical protein